MHIRSTNLHKLALLMIWCLGFSGCREDANPIITPTVDPPPIPRSGQDHGIAYERISVPVSGSPLAVAHLVQGGLRASHGSHFGFKSIVDDSVEGEGE